MDRFGRESATVLSGSCSSCGVAPCLAGPGYLPTCQQRVPYKTKRVSENQKSIDSGLMLSWQHCCACLPGLQAPSLVGEQQAVLFVFLGKIRLG